MENDVKDTLLKADNIFLSVLFIIAMSLSGWALVNEVDLQARVKVLEAVSETEKKDNDRRFNELADGLKKIEAKLDKISDKVGAK